MQLPFVLYKDVLLNIPVTSDEWLYRDIETKVTLKANIKSFIRCIQYTVQQYHEYDVKFIWNNSYIWTAVVDQSEEWSSQ